MFFVQKTQGSPLGNKKNCFWGANYAVEKFMNCHLYGHVPLWVLYAYKKNQPHVPAQ